MATSSEPFLFEASWEVCNKVGGIYTVVSSKANQALQHFPERYFAVGPYLPSLTSREFAETALPEAWQGIAADLETKGVVLHYGNWIPVSHCPTLLLDCSGLTGNLNHYKEVWWEKYQLDTLGTDFYDIDQPLIWSLAVGLLIESFAQSTKKPVIAHGHEWLSGGMFLHLGSDFPSVRTVFTTHATVLGRALSSTSNFIYKDLTSFNPEQEAINHNVKTKHQLEKLSANLSTSFTTVSRITADEATAFLGRTADFVVENGLDLDILPGFDELCHSSTEVRKALNNFALAYFGVDALEINQVHYQFTMGRYEFHNKGYDMYLESLSELNQRLIKEESTDTVISFILVPGRNGPLKNDISLRLTAQQKVISFLADHTSKQNYARYTRIVSEQNPQPSELEPREQLYLDPILRNLTSPEEAPLSPYAIPFEEQDAFMQAAAKHGLRNHKVDRVKLVIIPLYLDGFDGIFNLPLYELVPGFDLGVFPSLYEPWGYTPMESLVLGVPAITCNLAGFGRALEDSKSKNSGALILDRSANNPDQERTVLTDYLYRSVKESRRDHLLKRMNAYMLMEDFSWKKLYAGYLSAYGLPKHP